MNPTTVLELVALAAGVVAFPVWLRRLGLRVSPWDAVIADHVEATGRYLTVAEWRSGRVGRDANRPEPAPAGPVTVTVTAVDGKPVLTPSGGRHLYYAQLTGPGWDGVRLGNAAGTLDPGRGPTARRRDPFHPGAGQRVGRERVHDHRGHAGTRG